jgi:hypothetical protein
LANDVADSLLEDAANAQRERGQIPTPEDNADLILPILERMDRKQDSVRVYAQPEPERPNVDREAKIAAEYERRGGENFADMEVRRGGNMASESRPMPQGPGITGPAQNMMGMRTRLKMLRLLPEWEPRTKQVSLLTIQAQALEAKQGKAQAKAAWGLAHGALRKLLADSASAHGPWWEPEKKIISHG